MNSEEFYKWSYPSTWILTKVDMDGKEAIILRDRHGKIITEKEFYEMARKAKRFYDSQKNSQEEIEEVNRYIDFNNASGITHNFTSLEPGQTIRLPEAKIEFKEFRSDLKRKWSCKCALCEAKISSDKDTGYYLLDFAKYIRHMNIDVADDWFGFRRACSPECARVIWKYIFKEWIKENNYERFFIVD